MYAEINCPQCHTEAKVDHIDLDQHKAKCMSCHHVYSIDSALQQMRNKVRVQLPEKWETTKSINSMDLSFPWSTNAPDSFKKVRGCFEAITIIPGVIAMIFISFWIIGFTKQSLERNETLNLLVGLAFSAGGIGLLFWMFFTKKKKTHTLIQLDNKNLNISLPTLQKSDTGSTQFQVKKNTTLAKSRIKQLFVIKNGPLYNVMLLDKDGTLHDFLYPFFNLDHALYVEQSIEDLLVIKDESISNEIKL